MYVTCTGEVSTVKCWKSCHHWDISPSGRHRDGDQSRFPKLLRVLVPRVQVKTVGVTHGLGTREGVKTMELSISLWQPLHDVNVDNVDILKPLDFSVFSSYNIYIEFLSFP